MSDRPHNAIVSGEWKELVIASEAGQTRLLFLSEFPPCCKLVKCNVSHSTLCALSFQLPKRRLRIAPQSCVKKNWKRKGWKASVHYLPGFCKVGQILALVKLRYPTDTSPIVLDVKGEDNLLNPAVCIPAWGGWNYPWSLASVTAL